MGKQIRKNPMWSKDLDGLVPEYYIEEEGSGGINWKLYIIFAIAWIAFIAIIAITTM